MGIRKRRRVDLDAVAERPCELPDCLLHHILSRLGSRQAVQTSVLSRRWRNLWRDVPCIDVDEREFADETWERFEDFADNILPPSLPQPVPKLDAFRLHLSTSGNRCRHGVSDRWIRRGLRRSPAAVAISASNVTVARWTIPSQLSTLGRLKTLRLVRVTVAADGFFQRLGGICPVLEELHVEDCRVSGLHDGIISPTLTRLVVIAHRGHVIPAYLIRAAPRLTSLRLDLTHNTILFHAGPHFSGPPLPVVEASIRITRAGYGNFNDNVLTKSKLDFLSSMRCLLARLPNAATLRLSGFTTTALLDDQSQEFPTLQSLRALVLEDCDVGSNFHALTSILRSTPNLEKLGLHLCTFVGAVPISKQHGAAGVLRCDKLESIELTYMREDEHHLLDLLSKLSDGMSREQWQRMRKSTKLVI